MFVLSEEVINYLDPEEYGILIGCGPSTMIDFRVVGA
jgi:hypothetical protein